MTLVWLLLGFALAFIGVGIVWRYASRRWQLPCPTWFAWSLEGGLADKVAGTQTTLERIAFKPGGRVLEIGPGPGRLLVHAAKRVLPGGEVVGLDIQPGMLERLEARANAEGVKNLTTKLGDAAVEHFPAASFDLVYMCTVLGEIPDRRAAIAQCFRVLKPGGRLSITEIFPDPHYQSRATVTRLATEVGFRDGVVLGSWRFFTANFVKPA